MELDQKELEIIWRIYSKEFTILYDRGLRIFHNSFMAEDAVQKTFLIACQKADDLQSSPNPEGWIRKTFKYVCNNAQHEYNRYVRELISLEKDISVGNNVEDWIESTDSEMEQYIDPEGYRILKKIILEGYSYRDLSAELGISESTCRKRFQRAKERFRKRYMKEQ